MRHSSGPNGGGPVAPRTDSPASIVLRPLTPREIALATAYVERVAEDDHLIKSMLGLSA